MLFLISHQLCKEYPALSPFAVDEQRYCDVIGLYADVIGLNMEINKTREAPKKRPQKDEIIRRPAGDNWF